MNDSDFYLKSAQKRYQILEAAKSRASADLAEAKACGDYDSAADEIQIIANLSAEQANIERLHQQYQQQQNQAAEPMTDSEFMGMSPAKMARNPAAVDAIFRKSKYYTEGQWGDPDVQRRIQEGYAEVARRKGVERGG